jgi:hypothetical protein
MRVGATMYKPGIILISLGLLTGIARAQAQGEADRHRTITVSGSADVQVKPDRVVLTLGIETRDTVLAKCVRDNEARSGRVLTFLRERRIPQERIQTPQPAVRTVFDPGYGMNRGTKLWRYEARRAILVTLVEVSELDQVLTGCLERGVSEVDDADFRTTELKKHREEARALAIRAAEDKARRLAAELGARPGPVQSIAEDHLDWGDAGSWWGWSWNRGMRGQSQVVVSADRASDEALEALALGRIPVSARIRASFLLE